jgi:nucleotide-binding universal stress UspA family protein
MNHIKKIICPIDFSKYAEAALQMALPIADSYKSEVHLLHIIPKIYYYDWNMTGMYNLLTDEMLEQAMQDASDKMNVIIHECKSKFPSIIFQHSIINRGDPADGILEIANESKADLIVMGSHGRKGWDRLLMGSVAEFVMRHAACQVLIYKL